jgi:hypothetical protein
MIRVWYGVIAAFIGSFSTALCSWLLYLKDGGNEAFYAAISTSIVALLSGVGIVVHFVVPHDAAVPGQALKTGSHQAEKRMKCRYCGGTGKYVLRAGNISIADPCEVCKGHGDFLTALWSQPDCNYCGGSGGVVFRSGNVALQETCDICGGTGKRPFGI